MNDVFLNCSDSDVAALKHRGGRFSYLNFKCQVCGRQKLEWLLRGSHTDAAQSQMLLTVDWTCAGTRTRTLVRQCCADQPLWLRRVCRPGHFDQSHPWGEHVRRQRAWETGCGPGMNSKSNRPGPWEPTSCRAKNMPDWCLVWQPQRGALPGKTVTHSGRGLRSSWRSLPPKLAQAYTRGIRSRVILVYSMYEADMGERESCSISLLWAYRKCNREL